MALDFFEFCPSYQNAARMTRETRERRRIIIAQMPDDYSVRSKKTQSKIKWALEEAGIKASVSLIRADFSLIRATFRFLNGSEVERANLLAQVTKGHPHVSAIRYFQKCQMDTWQKVLEAKVRAEAPTPVPEPRDAIQMFLSAAQGIADELRAVRSENHRLTADNFAMGERIQAIEARIGGFDISQLESFLVLARELKAGVRTPAPAAPEVVSNFPEGPQAAPALADKPVVYSEQFVRNARQLDSNTRRELHRVLQVLMNEGVKNPTIKCGTHPSGNKKNCRLHRMFIIWEETPKNIQLHWIESGGKPIGK